MSGWLWPRVGRDWEVGSGWVRSRVGGVGVDGGRRGVSRRAMGIAAGRVVRDLPSGVPAPWLRGGSPHTTLCTGSRAGRQISTTWSCSVTAITGWCTRGAGNGPRRRRAHARHPAHGHLRAPASRTGLNYCRTTAAAPFRSTYFWILPVAVFGSSLTNVTLWGALKWARRSRQSAISSCSVALEPGLSTT
jgi:hypothetical protein